MFLVVDIVHSACPDVNVTRVKDGSTDILTSERRIRTVLANALPLRLPEELLCEVDDLPPRACNGLLAAS